MTGANKKLPGFSLFEMLLVVALFMTSSVILSQMFISFNQLHRRVSNMAVLGQDMRFATELIVRAARNNQIDYSYEPLLSYDNQLSLVTGNGGTINIALLNGADCADATVTNCLAMSLDGGTTWQPITARRVNVTEFGVYVRPLNSPFVPSASGYDNNNQPFVTFKIGMQYMADDVRDRVKMESQATVTSRIYAR